jgi:hypothetical protein
VVEYWRKNLNKNIRYIARLYWYQQRKILSVGFTIHHEDGAQGAESTLSGYCSQKECDHPRVACLESIHDHKL